MMNTQVICALVLNWNGWQDTCECLSSLLSAKRIPDTIVVVDNRSDDESIVQIIAWADNHFPSIVHIDGAVAAGSTSGDNPPSCVLIRNRRNLGYAGGNNSAISWALAQGCYEYLWILNNDTLVSADSLARLIDCAGKSDAGIFGATVVFAEQPHVVQCAGGWRYNPLTTIFKSALAGMSLTNALQTQDVEEIDYVYGAAMFVRAEVFASCGLLNEEYFLFYEEIDFCKRAKQRGYSLAWCREAVIAHKVSRSVARLGGGGREQLAFANYHENLSTLIFSWRFHKLFFPFILCFRFFGKLAVLARRREWFLIRPLLQAYRDFLFCRRRYQRP